MGLAILLAGAIAGASTNIQNVFSTISSIADQSLFLTDLVEFLQRGPKICSKPDALPAPRPIRDGFVFEKVTFSYPRSRAASWTGWISGWNRESASP
jgi:ATP-binding cassette subfamily B protein